MELIEQHYIQNRRRLIQKYAKTLGSTASAEDVVQEAYYRAMKYYSSFDGVRFESWFSMVCKNALRNFQAEERGHFHEELDEFGVPGFKSDLEIEYLWEQILDLAKRENPEHREVLRLHFERGYNSLEISQVSELSYSNIRQIISRFRNKIQKELQ